MKQIIRFLLFITLLPAFSYADSSTSATTNESIDAETNISIIIKNIKLNEDEFIKLAEQIAKKYPDFDWVTFDRLDLPSKRIVLKNYLARLAFDEIKQNYIKDIYARAQDGVIVKKRDDGTYYFNTSNEKYWTTWVTGADIARKAAERTTAQRCDGCEWVYFKQSDTPILDEIIEQETAKAPAEIHCEKYCSILNQKKEEQYQNFLLELKQSYDKINKLQQECLSNMRKYGYTRKQIKEKRQEFADYLRKMEQNYNNWEKIWRNGREWFNEPYTPDCEMVTVGCFNVEQRPPEFEEFVLHLGKPGDVEYIYYDYDDAQNNIHIEASAYKNCNCSMPDDIVNQTSCQCVITFFDTEQDFTKVRNWDNQHRIDLKNGMLQDLDESGHHKHHWDSNVMPMGKVTGHWLDLNGWKY